MNEGQSLVWDVHVELVSGAEVCFMRMPSLLPVGTEIDIRRARENGSIERGVTTVCIRAYHGEVINEWRTIDGVRKPPTLDDITMIVEEVTL